MATPWWRRCRIGHPLRVWLLTLADFAEASGVRTAMPATGADFTGETTVTQAAA
jgi:hypothetical protein